MKTAHMLPVTVQDSSADGGDSPSEKHDAAADMALMQRTDTRKFIICFLGIFVSYFVYGLLQEKITRGRYVDGENEERFTYTLVLVFVQCLVNVVFARCALQIYCPEKDNSPQQYYALMAFSYLGAMVASNLSLQYVSYPTQVLGKSAKPIPVMILGVIMARKRYPFRKYIFVLLIVIGVALFMYKDKKATDTTHTFGSGEVLLLMSLFLDGITGGVQDKLRAEHRSPTHCMMLWMNVWSVLYLGTAIILTGEGFRFLAFASRFPMVIINMLLFSVCSAVGQNFIFMTVTNFGPLTCSIFTTTRKFFTILASVIIFQNPMNSRQWIGTICVFIGLALDNMYGKEPKKGKPVKNSS